VAGLTVLAAGHSGVLAAAPYKRGISRISRSTHGHNRARGTRPFRRMEKVRADGVNSKGPQGLMADNLPT